MNRILHERLGGRRLHFTDAQRRKLAAKGRAVARRTPEQLAGLETPDTIDGSIGSARVVAHDQSRRQLLAQLGSQPVPMLSRAHLGPSAAVPSHRDDG
jgi:hypothetical protein